MPETPTPKPEISDVKKSDEISAAAPEGTPRKNFDRPKGTPKTVGQILSSEGRRSNPLRLIGLNWPSKLEGEQ